MKILNNFACVDRVHKVFYIFLLFVFSIQITNAQTIQAICSTDTIYLCPDIDSICGVWVNRSVGYSDTCSGVEVLYSIDIDNDGSVETIGWGNLNKLLPYGIHRLKWLVSDNCNNDSCVQILVLEDCSKPVATCYQGIITVFLDDQMDCEYEVLSSEVDAGSTDNCSFTSSFAKDSLLLKRVFTINNAGINEITLWIRDNNNNYDSCEFTLNIVSGIECSEVPIIGIHCADSLIICESNDLTCGTQVNSIIGYFDTCSMVTVSYSIDYNNDGSIDNSGHGYISEILPYGDHVIHWYVEDDCGIDSCNQFIMLSDCTLPISNCFGGVISISLDENDEFLLGAMGFTDNCGVTISFELDSVVSSILLNCDNLGSTSITVYAWDEAGNSLTCQQMYFIEDLDESCIVSSFDIRDKFSLDLFPNPAKYNDEIQIFSDREIESISILDVNGVQLYSSSITNLLDLNSINLSGGTYFVKVIDREGYISVKKLFIE